MIDTAETVDPNDLSGAIQSQVKNVVKGLALGNGQLVLVLA